MLTAAAMVYAHVSFNVRAIMCDYGLLLFSVHHQKSKLTSNEVLATSYFSFVNISMSLSSMNLSPYTLLASWSQSRTKSIGVFRHIGVEKRTPCNSAISKL